jgi:hypothetical protein
VTIIRKEIVEPTTLFVTDAELIRRLGVPEEHARAAIFMLDRKRDSGFSPEAGPVGKSAIGRRSGRGLIGNTSVAGSALDRAGPWQPDPSLRHGLKIGVAGHYCESNQAC